MKRYDVSLTGDQGSPTEIGWSMTLDAAERLRDKLSPWLREGVKVKIETTSGIEVRDDDEEE